MCSFEHHVAPQFWCKHVRVSTLTQICEDRVRASVPKSTNLQSVATVSPVVI